MIKTFLLFLLALTMSYADTVQAKFDYNFTNVVRCSPTVTTRCLEKFEVGTLEGGVFTRLVDVPLPGGTGPVTDITPATFEVRSIGTTLISAIAVGKDENGARITSKPEAATAPLKLEPGSPTGVRVTTVTVTVNVITQQEE